MLSYCESIWLLSHTGPIPASSGGELFSGTTAASPHCCGQGYVLDTATVGGSIRLDRQSSKPLAAVASESVYFLRRTWLQCLLAAVLIPTKLPRFCFAPSALTVQF